MERSDLVWYQLDSGWYHAVRRFDIDGDGGFRDDHTSRDSLGTGDGGSRVDHTSSNSLGTTRCSDRKSTLETLQVSI